VNRLGILLLAFHAVCTGYEDIPPHLPPAVYTPPPVLLVAGATHGLIDASGKLWAWKAPNAFGVVGQGDAEVRAGIERAWKSREPLLVNAAQLLLVVDKQTYWSDPRKAGIWAYNGAAWDAIALEGDESPLGMAALAIEGLAVFGTATGLIVRDANGWCRVRLLPQLAEPRQSQGRLRFIQDHAGVWYAWYPGLGSLWRLSVQVDPARREPRHACLGAAELPVLDSREDCAVGEVARHPDGTMERPKLLAGGLLLEKAALQPPSPASDEELAQLVRAFSSDNFETRDAAAKKLKEDGKDGAWKYTKLLLDPKSFKSDDPELRSQLIKAVGDRIARFEPGCSRGYAEQLQRLGFLDEAYVREKGGNYKHLWVALEEKGFWDRETRVGYERARRETRLEAMQLQARNHGRFLPWAVNGRLDHNYVIDDYHIGTSQEYFEEKDGTRLWIAMGSYGVVRLGRQADDALLLAGCWYDKEHNGRKVVHLNTASVLGRDRQGRLLVVALIATPEAQTVPDSTKEMPGIWSIEDAKAQTQNKP